MRHRTQLPNSETSKSDIENIRLTGRLVRFIVALGLILAVSPEFPIDKSSYVILIPLFAVYPLLTSILGWDPIIELWRSGLLSNFHKSKGYNNAQNHQNSTKLTPSNS